MEHEYRRDSYHYKRTHGALDRTEGRYIHFSGDPIELWYDTFCPPGATPPEVRLGPSPFTRHLFTQPKELADVVDFKARLRRTA